MIGNNVRYAQLMRLFLTVLGWTVVDAASLGREFAEFQRDPMVRAEGLYAELVGEDVTHWMASFMGPKGTPYEGGKFWVEIYDFPNNYPVTLPKIAFRTEIYHPNIQGEQVCAGFLKANCGRYMNVTVLLLTLQRLLAEPNFEHPFFDTTHVAVYEIDPTWYEEIVREKTLTSASPSTPAPAPTH